MPSTYHSTIVPAPAEEVWRSIRDFHDFSWAADAVESCTPVGEVRGDQAGARRIVNDCFQETLLTVDDADLTLRYRLDDGPSPVSPAEVQDFIAVVRVRPVTDDGGGAFVEWSASWVASDERAVEFAGGIYRALLAALRTSMAHGEGSRESS